MVNTVADIDIDFADRNKILEIIPAVTASRDDNGVMVKHNVGVYLHETPIDPFTRLCSLTYKEASERGYFKFDFLNVRAYGLEDIESEEHLQRLIDTEPCWDFLCNQEITDTLFQIRGDDNFELLQKTKPRSIPQLAMTLAMQRPAKRYLVGKSWNEIEKHIWTKSEDKYQFRKSHSTAYAIAIVVQMNLLAEQAS